MVQLPTTMFKEWLVHIHLLSWCLSLYTALSHSFCVLLSATDITEIFHIFVCDQVQNCSIFFPRSSETKSKENSLKELLEQLVFAGRHVWKKDLQKSYKILYWKLSVQESCSAPQILPFLVFLPSLAFFVSFLKKTGTEFSWHKFQLVSTSWLPSTTS